MRGLVIREPWIGLILTGAKTWEMRSRPTSIRGRIALLRAGAGLVCGVADLAECLPALTPDEMKANVDRHGIPEARHAEVLAKGWTIPWVLRNVRRLDPPIPYLHPSGAVTWVHLPDAVTKHIELSRDTGSAPAQTSPETIGAVLRPVPPRPETAVGEWVDIRLTEGNLRNNHIYLRSAARLLPERVIGGANKGAAASTKLTVQFYPGASVATDIAGDKMILRARGPVRDFFERSGAMAGDMVRFRKLSDEMFEITLARDGGA